MKKLKSFNEFFFIQTDNTDRIPADDEQPETEASDSCKNCDCDKCSNGDCGNCEVCCSTEEEIPANTNAYRRRMGGNSDTLRRPVIADEVVESRRNRNKKK